MRPTLAPPPFAGIRVVGPPSARKFAASDDVSRASRQNFGASDDVSRASRRKFAAPDHVGHASRRNFGAPDHVGRASRRDFGASPHARSADFQQDIHFPSVFRPFWADAASATARRVGKPPGNYQKNTPPWPPTKYQQPTPMSSPSRKTPPTKLPIPTARRSSPASSSFRYNLLLGEGFLRHGTSAFPRRAVEYIC